jgi:hypothetical protein
MLSAHTVPFSDADNGFVDLVADAVQVPATHYVCGVASR